MRITLLNLPWNRKGFMGIRAGSRFPFTSKPDKDDHLNYIPFPFFLAYSTSLLKKEGNDAKLIDAIAEELNEEKVIERLKFLNPELIVVETSTPSFKNDLKVLRNIHSKLSHCKIAMCGPHASVFSEQILNEHSFINYTLIGEYEFTLLDLVNCLKNNIGMDSVLGLAYRQNSELKINKPRPTISNLDGLPWPEREDVPIYRYNDGFAGLPQPNVQMWSSRGCTFQCIYCLWPQTIYREHRYRKRSPQDVVDEMEYLIRKFNFKAVYFDDDVFNINRIHVLDICEKIIRREIKVPWAIMARADLMEEELLTNLASAGLYAVKYGIESANQDVLNCCKKNMDLNKTRQIIKLTKELGIKVHLTFCLGLPQETRQAIQETVNFINETNPDSLQFSFATPYPGTEYFEYLNRQGYLLSKVWTNYEAQCKYLVKTEELDSQDLERIKIDLSNHFDF